jgi:hypothetical protein
MIRQTDGEAKYVKVYLERDMSILTDKEYRVLHELGVMMGYGNVVELTVSVKKELCFRCRVKSLGSLYVILGSLCKKGIIVGEKGKYILDARFFGKGSWRDIKLLREG